MPPTKSAATGVVPALTGIRGLAALAVVWTHVAFNTGAISLPVVGRMWDRFGMAVAVFFALSGFLLWRPHANAAAGGPPPPKPGRYLLHRAARILPAYWVVVFVVLALLPRFGHSVTPQLWLANLGLVQVFVPLALTDGLTQMWSLSVEVAFYLLVPVMGVLVLSLGRLVPRSRRVWAVLALGVLSLSWNFLPIPTPNGVYADNWMLGYLPWFAAGMVLAELAVAQRTRTTGAGRWWALAGNCRVLWPVALLAYAISVTELAGPPGLARAQPWQYAVKMALGAVIGFSLLSPLVLGDGRHRWLCSPLLATVGRWSYGIFIWHLAVLSIVLPMFGFMPFAGGLVHVFALTVALTIPLAAASYALVEEPVRHWARRRFG